MLLPVLGIARVMDSLHQMLFVGEVIAGGCPWNARNERGRSRHNRLLSRNARESAHQRPVALFERAATNSSGLSDPTISSSPLASVTPTPRLPLAT